MAGLARESSRLSFRPPGVVCPSDPARGPPASCRHNRNNRRRTGLTLTEVVVVVATVALAVAVLLPGLAAAREESLAARCGANRKPTSQAYSRRAGDHNRFWHPRPRAAPRSALGSTPRHPAPSPFACAARSRCCTAPEQSCTQ